MKTEIFKFLDYFQRNFRMGEITPTGSGQSMGTRTLAALLMIEIDGAQSQGVLARALKCSTANMVSIAETLEHHGLAERKHAEDDRRKVRLCLTVAGSNHLQTARRMAVTA